MLKKGYLLFPKVLFEEQIKVTKGATGYFDAFILVLTHVNYSTVECRIHQYTFRTRYFFNKMYDEGIIERLSNPYITHIRIPDYDLLVGQKRRESVRAEADGITFDAFWEKYHDITRKPKTNVGRARREWNKLSVNERCLSLSHIDEYYDNLADIKYCMQAASYLSNKAFMNEYDY